MNKNEDVLVLFITSHGSASAGVSLEMCTMRADDVDSTTLRELLD